MPMGNVKIFGLGFAATTFLKSFMPTAAVQNSSKQSSAKVNYFLIFIFINIKLEIVKKDAMHTKTKYPPPPHP